MNLENRTNKEAVEEVDSNATFMCGSQFREMCDNEFMKKNNITRQSHEQRDMGLALRDDTYVTVWVPYK